MQEEQRTEAALADLAESAQLHHQLRILGAALQTAQLDPAQFGLNAAVWPLALVCAGVLTHVSLLNAPAVAFRPVAVDI